MMNELKLRNLIEEGKVAADYIAAYESKYLANKTLIDAKFNGEMAARAAIEKHLNIYRYMVKEGAKAQGALDCR